MDKQISAVYITKNEENTLPRSILSCLAIIDELIVVDTGSTDSTVEKAAELGAHIFHYDWTNNFSEARNFAIAQCSKDYIMFLDADEYFSPSLTREDKEKILSFDNGEVEAVSFRNEDINPITNVVNYTRTCIRLFKNNIGIQYIRPIHEYLINTTHPNQALRVMVDLQHTLIHKGYADDFADNKCKRNLQILEQIKDKTTLDYFYLCREHLTLKKYEEAEKYCNLFLTAPDKEDILERFETTRQVFYYKLHILQNIKAPAQQIIDYLKEIKPRFINDPKYYYEAGKFWFGYDIDKSEELFKECLIKQKDRETENNFDSDFFENFKIDLYRTRAKIDKLKGKSQSAINKAGVACIWDKTNKDSAILLFNLLDQSQTQKAIDKNIDFINKIYTPQTVEQHQFLVQTLAYTKLFNEFIIYALQLIRHPDIAPEYTGIELYYAEILSTDRCDIVLDKIKNKAGADYSFVRLICLLYSASTNYQVPLAETLAMLPQSYYNAYRALIGEKEIDNLTDKDIDIIERALIRLLYMGYENLDLQFIFNLIKMIGYDGHISHFLGVLVNGNDKANLAQALEILEYCYAHQNEINIDFDLFYKDYFYVLFILQDYNELIDLSKTLESVSQIPYINLKYIKAALPDKSHIKIQRQIINRIAKEMSNCGKS